MNARKRVLTTVAVLVGALLSVPSADAANTAERSGHQRFVLITTKTVEGGPIAANGVIHAKGKDVTLKGHRDRFEFPAGNVIIRHQKTKGTGHNSYDPKTCLFTHRERGTWRAINGTRAYADVSGGGGYRLLIQGFTCDPDNTEPDPFFTRVVATGKLSF